MSNCIFCKIVEGKIPSDKVYEDEDILCFHDIAPEAPVHVLIVPKKHIPSMNELSEEDGELIAKLLLKIKDIAAQLELDNGYRVVNNCGEDGMQTIKHLHFHLLGQRQMKWPPG